MLDSNVKEVIATIEARALVGLKKYNTDTDRDDLTTEEWLNHAREEAMDLAVYLTRCIKEIKTMKKRISQLEGRLIDDLK
jgi:hypothetical protein